MKNNLKLVLGLLLVGAASIISSCQKDGMTTKSNSDQGVAGVRDESMAHNESAKIDDIANLLTFDNSSLTRGLITQLPSCATIVYDTASATKTITVNFGTTPCLSDWDNKYREGVLIISWTGNLKQPGNVRTITTQNYFVGDSANALDEFNYTKTITNMGTLPNGNLHFSISIPAGTIDLFSGGTITWTGNFISEWTQGANTSDPSDDVFMITGSSSGTDRNGLPFNMQIVTPLTKDDCAWIVSGVKQITHGTYPTKTLDFGDGTCDNIATLTVNGNSTTIFLQ